MHTRLAAVVICGIAVSVPALAEESAPPAPSGGPHWAQGALIGGGLGFLGGTVLGAATCRDSGGGIIPGGCALGAAGAGFLAAIPGFFIGGAVQWQLTQPKQGPTAVLIPTVGGRELAGLNLLVRF